MRFYIVEDDSALLDTLLDCLGGAGHQVVAARNLEELEAELQRESPDFVIFEPLLDDGSGGKIEIILLERSLPFGIHTKWLPDVGNFIQTKALFAVQKPTLLIGPNSLEALILEHLAQPILRNDRRAA